MLCEVLRSRAHESMAVGVDADGSRRHGHAGAIGIADARIDLAPRPSQARASSTAAVGVECAGCHRSKVGNVVAMRSGVGQAGRPDRPRYGARSRRPASIVVCIEPRIRSAVLALPLRWPKYTVNDMPRSRVCLDGLHLAHAHVDVQPADLRCSPPRPGWHRHARQPAQATSLGQIPDSRRMRSRLSSATSGADFERVALGCINAVSVVNSAMRGRDEDTGEFLSPSRSQNRREALAVLALGEKLTALSDGATGAGCRSPSRTAATWSARSQRITSPARASGNTQFLAKQMRRQDDDTLDAIRRSLEQGPRDAGKRETAALHRFGGGARRA
jgi:hypothetical protein